jgi:alkylation response protein AidB-like acyl-CoA dehydrogenase
MNFDYTDEQIMFRNMAREFAQREIAPVTTEDDRGGHFRREIIEKMGALGLCGAPIPREYGGLGTDYITYTLICEEIARVSASVFTTITVHVSTFQIAILLWGNEEQKRKYLPKATTGEMIGCFGLTEPNIGSDAANMETTARKDGKEWALDGNKMWITNGGVAGLAIVAAQTDKAKRHRGITSFLVEKGTPGFSSKDIENKLGLHACNTAELILQNCRVPEESILGQVGDGFKVMMSTLDCGRVSIASGSVGVAQASIDAATKYAQERIQFGKPIASFQLVQEMLVDMIVETEAARFLVHHAAFLKDKGEPFTREASIAKVFASDVAQRSAMKAIKVHGGYGYSGEYPVERYYRDAMAMVLYEGTTEIQKLVIGRETLGISAVS